MTAACLGSWKVKVQLATQWLADLPVVLDAQQARLHAVSMRIRVAHV